jgi:hypothetical protein
VEDRHIGAASIVGVQDALGYTVTYADALKKWDAMTEEEREEVVLGFELIYEYDEDTVIVRQSYLECSMYSQN